MNRIERNLQEKVARWLRDRNAVVLKTSPGVLNPTGIPDLLFLYGNKWGMVEVKTSQKSKHQTLQELQQERFSKMNPGMIFEVHPDNWPEVRSLLELSVFSA